MSVTQDRIQNRLSASADLTAVLVGGIWTRRLERIGEGATPQAFAPTPPYQPRPAAVVIDGGETVDPFGPDAAFQGFPEVWLYAPATGNGKAAIDQAWNLAFGLLHRWRFATANGTGVLVRVAGRLGVTDDPVVGGRVLDRMRLQLVGLWRNTN